MLSTQIITVVLMKSSPIDVYTEHTNGIPAQCSLRLLLMVHTTLPPPPYLKFVAGTPRDLARALLNHQPGSGSRPHVSAPPQTENAAS